MNLQWKLNEAFSKLCRKVISEISLTFPKIIMIFVFLGLSQKFFLFAFFRNFACKVERRFFGEFKTNILEDYSVFNEFFDGLFWI